jgi:ribosome-associated toxin RatA of RatAB toxin-antitoxin module
VIEIRRSALVGYSAAQMFDLVNDVEAYPKRFAWCAAAKILEAEGDMQVVRLDLKFAGLRQSFTTRNRAERPLRLHMQLVRGPFSHLEGLWAFQPLGEDVCKVSLALDFEYTGLGASALRLGFQALANRMVDDFSKAARQVYG